MNTYSCNHMIQNIDVIYHQSQTTPLSKWQIGSLVHNFIDLFEHERNSPKQQLRLLIRDCKSSHHIL